MRIKEIVENSSNLNEFLEPEFNISNSDAALILSVNETDFSKPMSGDELMKQVYATLGMA